MSMLNCSVCLLMLCLGLVGIVRASELSAIEELRREITEMKTSIEKRHQNAENEIKELRAAMKLSDDRIQSLEAENQHLKEERHSSKRYLLNGNPFAEKPAFSASLTKHAENLGTSQTIIFDHAFTNDIGAYSPVTGVFTVPMNGTYFFTATVMSHSGQYVQSEICLNGQGLVNLYSYDDHYEQGTNSVVLALHTGDSVWVRHKNAEGSNVHGNNWSSFSGFLL